MKFTIPAPALKAALARCARVVERRNGIPILAHVHLSAAETLTIRATNLQTYVAVEIENVDITDAGEICAPADELLKFASAAGKSTIAIETDAYILRMSWARSSAELHTMEATDMPVLKREGEELRPVDGELLTAALRFCTPPIDPSHSSYFLQGAYILDAPGGARVYGTNGHAAHRAIATGTRFGGSGIIALADCALICDLSGPMLFHISENKWGVSAAGVEIWGSVIDGAFPDIDRAMPTLPVTAIADREALAEMIGLASIGTGGADKVSTAALNAADGALRARGIGFGASLASGAKAEMDAETKTPGAAAISTKYLTNALAAINSDLVALMIGDSVISIEPAEQRTDLVRSVVIMGRRVTEEQLAA